MENGKEEAALVAIKERECPPRFGGVYESPLMNDIHGNYDEPIGGNSAGVAHPGGCEQLMPTAIFLSNSLPAAATPVAGVSELPMLTSLPFIDPTAATGLDNTSLNASMSIVPLAASTTSATGQISSPIAGGSGTLLNVESLQPLRGLAPSAAVKLQQSAAVTNTATPGSGMPTVPNAGGRSAYPLQLATMDLATTVTPGGAASAGNDMGSSKCGPAGESPEDLLLAGPSARSVAGAVAPCRFSFGAAGSVPAVENPWPRVEGVGAGSSVVASPFATATRALNLASQETPFLHTKSQLFAATLTPTPTSTATRIRSPQTVIPITVSPIRDLTNRLPSATATTAVTTTAAVTTMPRDSPGRPSRRSTQTFFCTTAKLYDGAYLPHHTHPATAPQLATDPSQQCGTVFPATAAPVKHQDSLGALLT